MYTNVDNICYLYVVGMLIIRLDALTSLVFLILFIQPAWYLNFSTWFIKNMSVM
jgi:hypothetical protein